MVSTVVMSLDALVQTHKIIFTLDIVVRNLNGYDGIHVIKQPSFKL